MTARAAVGPGKVHGAKRIQPKGRGCQGSMRRRLETRSRAGAVILEPSRFDREHRFIARTTVHRAALLLCCKKRSRGRLMDLIQFQKICPIPHYPIYPMIIHSSQDLWRMIIRFCFCSWNVPARALLRVPFNPELGLFLGQKMDVPRRFCLLRQLRDHWKQSSCPNST